MYLLPINSFLLAIAWPSHASAFWFSAHVRTRTNGRGPSRVKEVPAKGTFTAELLVFSIQKASFEAMCGARAQLAQMVLKLRTNPQAYDRHNKPSYVTERPSTYVYVIGTVHILKKKKKHLPKNLKSSPTLNSY